MTREAPYRADCVRLHFFDEFLTGTLDNLRVIGEALYCAGHTEAQCSNVHLRSEEQPA